MKKYFYLSVIGMMALILFSACNSSKKENAGEQEATIEQAATAVTYSVDAAKSKIEWVGSKITGSQHNGTINFSNGTLSVLEDAIQSGSVTVDMKSITVLDLTDPKLNAKLTGHLKENDFFSVDSFPTSVMELTSVKKLEQADAQGNNYELGANLTIRGITKNINFPAKVEVTADQVSVKANLKIDRTQWNVRYGSGKFFKSLGDNMINDEFELKVALVAIKTE